MRKNFATIIIVIATIVLAGVAIFTAIRLYQIRQASVSPNAPASKPAAAGLCNGSCNTDTDCPTGMSCTNVACGTAGNLIGTYTLHGTSGSVTVDHTMTITAANADGTFSGTGFFNSDHAVVWTVTGKVTNSTNVTFHVVYTGTQAGYTDDFTGTIGAGGVWTGTTHDSANANGNETVTPLNCANAGVCRNSSCTSDNTCLCGSGAPSPTPGASSCQVTFTIAAASPTPTPVPTVTASPTPVPQCGTTCTTNSDCPSSMVCYVGLCRNAACTTTSSCICATATPAPSASPTPTAIVYATATPTPVVTAKPSLPVSGNDTPTIVAAAGGVMLLLTGLIFIL